MKFSISCVIVAAAAVVYRFFVKYTNSIKFCRVSIMEDNRYTPEIVWREEVLYLIRVNKEERALVDDEHDAKLAIDSIANFEMEKMRNEKTKVYRQESPDGKSISISRQSLGRLYNGSVSTKIKVDYVSVKRIRVLKGRFESKKPFIPPCDQELFLKSASNSVVLQDNDFTSETSSDTEDDLKRV